MDSPDLKVGDCVTKRLPDDPRWRSGKDSQDASSGSNLTRLVMRSRGEVQLTRVTIRRRFFWLLKNTLNPLTSRLARAGYGPFSLIRHVGRKSGRTYETPVMLVQVPEGFIAELTYGENVDWYRNVVAAGGCVVVHHRTEYHVTHIDPCSTEYGLGAYAAPFRFILKTARRKEFRLLRTEKSQAAE